MKRTPNWTPDQLEQLQKYAGTISCSEIGKMLGRTKDAVKNKITSLDLPRFTVTFTGQQKASIKPKKAHGPSPHIPDLFKKKVEKREPMPSFYKNHEAAAKKEFVRSEVTSRIEYCQQCGSPVSNWAEHEERLNHGRNG